MSIIIIIIIIIKQRENYCAINQFKITFINQNTETTQKNYQFTYPST